MPRLSRGDVKRIERAQTSARPPVPDLMEALKKSLAAPDADQAAEARRRPLVQYVITWTKAPSGYRFLEVHRSAAGSKPSHWLIDKPEFVGFANTITLARQFVPEGFTRMDRRKDDRVEVVEVWV